MTDFVAQFPYIQVWSCNFSGQLNPIRSLAQNHSELVLCSLQSSINPTHVFSDNHTLYYIRRFTYSSCFVRLNIQLLLLTWTKKIGKDKIVEMVINQKKSV